MAYEYLFQPWPKEKRRKPWFRPKWIIIVGFICLFLTILAKSGFWQKINFPKTSTRLSFSKKPSLPENLLKEVKKILEEKTGSYSFFVYDFKTGESFGINEELVFTAASVNKVPILASLYYLADKGELDLDEKVTVQASDIQDYGTGKIRYEGAGTVYSLKSLARLMMEKSDNTAAHILGFKIGLDKIQELCSKWGLIQTSMVDNKTSNKDMALLFLKMYKAEITNPAATLEMIGLMDESDFEERIPKLLPKDVKVYHKTGDEIGFVHDVGIVDLLDRPYYIGVLTSDVKEEAAAKEAIAQVSKLTFDNFLK